MDFEQVAPKRWVELSVTFSDVLGLLGHDVCSFSVETISPKRSDLEPTPNNMQEGRVAAALDIRYDAQFHDINRPEGFVHSAYQILRMPPGSFLTLAPVCSTWVFMPLGTILCFIFLPFWWWC